MASARWFIQTWSRPELSYGRWWSELKPLLSIQGKREFQYTDPAVIPRLRITGSPRVVDAGSSTSSTVAIPTDHGTFLVRLSRRWPGAGWMASELTFPRSSRGEGPGGPPVSAQGVAG